MVLVFLVCTVCDAPAEAAVLWLDSLVRLHFIFFYSRRGRNQIWATSLGNIVKTFPDLSRRNGLEENRRQISLLE